MPLRIAFVSLHTSPATQPGSGDAGGLNVVERAQADALADLGHHVELITRRTAPDAPDVVELAPRVLLRHLDAGPPTPLPKSEIDAHIDEFSAGFGELGPYDIVHSHHWMSGVAALPHTRAWGIPHVQSYHSVAALPGSPLAVGVETPNRPARAWTVMPGVWMSSPRHRICCMVRSGGSGAGPTNSIDRFRVRSYRPKI